MAPSKNEKQKTEKTNTLRNSVGKTFMVTHMFDSVDARLKTACKIIHFSKQNQIRLCKKRVKSFYSQTYVSVHSTWQARRLQTVFSIS